MANPNRALSRRYNATAATRDAIFIGCTGFIGASGAVATVLGDSGVSVSHTANPGEYQFTFPGLNTNQSNVTRFFIQIASPALTVVDAVVTAVDFTNGIITFKTLNATGVATNPAANDLLWMELKTSASGARQ